jgi:hypothetical protein
LFFILFFKRELKDKWEQLDLLDHLETKENVEILVPLAKKVLPDRKVNPVVMDCPVFLVILDNQDHRVWPADPSYSK